MVLEGMWKAKMETKMMDWSDDLMQILEISSVKTSSKAGYILPDYNYITSYLHYY